MDAGGANTGVEAAIVGRVTRKPGMIAFGWVQHCGSILLLMRRLGTESDSGERHRSDAIMSTALSRRPRRCNTFGLGIGSLLSLPPLIAQTEFAAGDVPRVMALVTAVNQAVFAFAPAVFGVLREVSGAYWVPFLLAAAVEVIAGAIIVLGRGVVGDKKMLNARWSRI